MAVGQLARALARQHQRGADAALDVDPGVGPGGAGMIGGRVELLLELEQALAERLEPARALVESQRAQGRTTDAPRVLEDFGEVDAGGADLRDHGARGRIANGDARVGRRRPIDPAM